jgi:5'-nucleotidase
MPRIVVTNDDGIFSDGLKQLAAALSEVGEVLVVAPDREQSATGHALTLTRPLRMHKVQDNWYAVDGTPTDCVNLAVLAVLKDQPVDLVCSGINFGLNLGDDVTYSGTVSACFEGTLLGIRSLAFSQEVSEGFSFERAARFAKDIATAVLASVDLPKDLLLNINHPAGPVDAVSFTRLGRRVYKQQVEESRDPRGRRYYWIGGVPQWQSDPGTDHHAVAAGKISVTPLHLDLTYYPGLKDFGSLQKSLDELDFAHSVVALPKSPSPE